GRAGPPAATSGKRPRRSHDRRQMAEEEEEEEEGAVLRRLREATGRPLLPPLPGLTPLSVPAGAVRAPLSGSAEPPARCVCYGLGRFSGCPVARAQLAFLLLLLEELGVPPGRCSLFDPAFSAREAAALGHLGLRLLPENEEGKHDVEGSATLFYMVHCGKALYNNLLWRNWSAGALARMVIVGNSFKGIEERWGQPQRRGLVPPTTHSSVPLLLQPLIFMFCSFSTCCRVCSHQPSPAFSLPHPR
uniref:SRR1 domain containing n=1 Tax=Strix occidentalis caurina TaxID=311401 RepID=A0A8D0KRJ1_STROC